MIRGKKGSLQDVVLIAMIVLFFAVVALISFKLSTEFNDFFQASSIPDDRGKDAAEQLNGYFPGLIDNVFLFFVIGLVIVTVLLAVLVRIHPIFIPLYLIGLMVVIFISGIMSNIYQEMAANSNLATQASQLVFISQVLEFLPFIVGIIGTIVMVVMYKLWKTNLD